MRRPTKRKGKPEHTRPRSTPRSAGPSTTPIFEAALRSARGIHASDDPLQIEVFVSALLGTFDKPLIDVPDSIDFIGQRLVTFLVGKRSDDALALLHGISAIADEPLASSARAGITRLRAAGRKEPASVILIGGHRFVEAWTSIDELGDQELVAASFEDVAGTPHAVVVMIDHNFDGLVREAFIAPTLDAIRESWSKQHGMAIVTLDAQSLADRLGQGLRMYRLYLDPPVSDTVDELVVLMRARLRALPSPREREYHEVGEKEREALVSAFVKSKEAGRSSSEVKYLASLIVDYRFDYTDGDPLRWSPIAVELFLLDWFPRKVTVDDDEAALVPDVLRRFVRYAARQKRLSADVIAETLEAIDEFEPQFLDAIGDSSRYGQAKSIVAAMSRDGIDLTDERAVGAWIAGFNARPLDERDTVLGSQGGDTADLDDDRPTFRVLPGGA